METNGAIYARLVDDLYEVVCSNTGNVKNIDKEAPNEATVNFNNTKTDIAKTITATVTQSDKGGSGVDIENCKWEYTTQESEIGTNEASYKGETFKTNPQELTLQGTIPGTYYLHILTIDKAGNKKESISKQAITVNDIDRIPPNDAIISLSANRVDKGGTVTATVTVSDSQSGINIENCKYIINNSASKSGIDASSWNTATKLSGVTSKIPIKSNTRGYLYLHILSVDNDGNKTETVSEGVYFAESFTVFRLTNGTYVSPCNRYASWPSGWSYKLGVTGYNGEGRLTADVGKTAYMQTEKAVSFPSFKYLDLSGVLHNGGSFARQP